MTRPLIAPDPQTLRTSAWDDYGLLDSGDGRKLERYGTVTVVRPEPQCFWRPALDEGAWRRADAVFDVAEDGLAAGGEAKAEAGEDTGRWRMAGDRAHRAPSRWPMAWGATRFNAQLTAFRHLAFFPEQAANWAWLDARVRAMTRTRTQARPDPPQVLNLFGYTGVASLVCAAAGAAVTHVDASKKAIGWARENAGLSGLETRPIRWICEDARRYVQREARRGSRYDGIILDPPKYGRGPAGEVWRLFEDLPALTAMCASLLSERADFLLLNAYAARVSGLSLAHLLAEAMAGRGAGPSGVIDWGELALVEAPGAGGGGREIGLSFFARWRGDDA